MRPWRRIEVPRLAEAIIQTRGLTKDYGSDRGLFDLDLDVQRGEIFGFLGPNGSGKTTAIRLLLDLIRPSRGAARILGQDIHTAGVAIRRRVGYLPGELAMYPALTGRQLLHRLAGLHGGVDMVSVHRRARRLRAELDHPLGKLSSGNRQKVGLIIAWMGDPELLILDEPTTGLDPLMQREVHGMLNEFRSGGGTVFLSSHALPEVEQVCDRVGIIREGHMLVVERLDALRRREGRRMVFTFAEPPPRGVFEQVPGVHHVAYRRDQVRMQVRGPVDGALKAAARFRVLALDAREADLDEVFMRYYGEDEHA